MAYVDPYYATEEPPKIYKILNTALTDRANGDTEHNSQGPVMELRDYFIDGVQQDLLEKQVAVGLDRH